MQPNSTISSRGLWDNRHAKPVLAVLAGFFLLLNLAAGMLASTDADEYQYVMNGWAVFGGLKPYVDFWDNHGPLSSYLYALPFYLLPEDHRILYAFRFGSWLNSVAISSLVFLLGRECFPNRRHLPFLAILILLASPVFFSKAREIRGDNPMNLLWMLSLWLQLRGLRRADPKLQFLSGIALGCVFGFSIKIVFVAFSAGLVFAAASWLQRRIPWKPVLSYACGFALPVVATLTFLWSSGMLRAFFDAYIGANVSRDHELTLRWFGRAYREYPFWMTMVTVGIVRPAWRIMRHRAEDAEFILLPVAAFLLFQFFFLLPTHNEQSLLPVQGPAALLVALAFWDWANTGFLKKNARLATAVLAVAVIASAWAGWRLTTRHFLARNPLAMQVAAGNRLMELSAPGDYVLSGAGPPLFRRKPLYHHSLVNHVRHQHVIGALDLQIPAALERNAVRLVVCDARIAALRDSDREYIAAHYQPLEEKLIDTAYVMVAGGTAAVNGTSATVDVRVPAEYRFETLPVRGGIRQVAATSGTVVRLEPGPHSVTTVDGVTTVVFAAAPIDLLAIDEITPGFSLPTGDMAKALRKLSTRSPDKSRKR